MNFTLQQQQQQHAHNNNYIQYIYIKNYKKQKIPQTKCEKYETQQNENTHNNNKKTTKICKIKSMSKKIIKKNTLILKSV